MSKNIKINLEKEVMSKIVSGKILMKPRWYFVLGSLLSGIGITLSVVSSIFFINLLFFISRKHGPNGVNRLYEILNSFPIWIPIIAIIGIIAGIFLLKRYDFSYKNNFYLIITIFIFSIVFAGFLIDKLNLNDRLSKKSSMKRFYRSIECPLDTPRGCKLLYF